MNPEKEYQEIQAKRTCGYCKTEGQKVAMFETQGSGFFCDEECAGAHKAFGEMNVTGRFNHLLEQLTDGAITLNEFMEGISETQKDFRQEIQHFVEAQTDTECTFCGKEGLASKMSTLQGTMDLIRFCNLECKERFQAFKQVKFGDRIQEVARTFSNENSGMVIDQCIAETRQIIEDYDDDVDNRM